MYQTILILFNIIYLPTIEIFPVRLTIIVLSSFSDTYVFFLINFSDTHYIAH